MSTDWESQLILARFQVDLRLQGAEEAYRAWDNQTSQPVILHLLPETDDEARRQLEARVRDLERVAHPGILPYLGLFEFSGQTFWVEGYVDGPTLRFALNAAIGQPLPLDEALIYLKSLASELSALHGLGWAHTRLRPENVRLDRNGAIYLSGLFSAQRIGEELPHTAEAYTAPEAPVSAATDVYALACLLYEMLAGNLPDERPLPDLRERNPDVPEFAARTLPRGLEESPANRIADATEFFLTVCLGARVEAQAVPERIGSGSGSPSSQLLETWNYLPPVTPPPSAHPQTLTLERARRRPSGWLWLLVAVCGLAAALLLGWYFLGTQTQSPAPQTSEQPVAALASDVPTAAEADVPAAAGNALVFPTDSPIPSLEAPDGLGGRIVFTCTRGDLNQLCMVLPTGGSVSRITAETAHFFYPVFSPDGDMLLFASNRDGNFELYLKLLSNDILTQLTHDLGEVSSASFSPDGKQIVFSNSVNHQPSSIWIVDRDGKDPQQFYEGTGNIASATWSPNGKSIAFAMSTPADPLSYEVFIMDAETKNVAPLTKGHLSNTGGSVDWSPDGRFVVLFAGPAGDHNIYSLEIVSGQIRQLTNGGNNAAPSYSPDGRWIVFNGEGSTGNANIYIMHPDGSDLRQLTFDKEPDWQPRWGR